MHESAAGALELAYAHLDKIAGVACMAALWALDRLGVFGWLAWAARCLWRFPASLLTRRKEAAHVEALLGLNPDASLVVGGLTHGDLRLCPTDDPPWLAVTRGLLDVSSALDDRERRLVARAALARMAALKAEADARKAQDARDLIVRGPFA